MKILSTQDMLDGCARLSEKTVVALGVFDGFHLGHQALLEEAGDVKSTTGFSVLVMTFHPHPRTLTGNSNGYEQALTPPLEKSCLAADLGADYYVSADFTKELAATPPLEFARKYLVQGANAGHVVCGFNFTFGHRGRGTPADLEKWGPAEGFRVSVVPAVEADGAVVSSTRVRAAVMSGDMTEAAKCLGRPYCLQGTVGHGEGRGRRIGVPTANLVVSGEKVVPRNGVYAALARFASGQGIAAFPAVVNIGTRPTFGGEGVRVECHMPGFRGTLYDQAVQVFFLRRLRDERRFPDALSLKAQVLEDVKSLESIVALDGASRKAASFTVPRAYDRMLEARLP